MQGFRPFSGKGHRIGGDEKRADDLDDGDVQLVTTDMDSGVLHSYIRRLDNLKVVTSGWMHSLQKNDKSPFQCLNDLDHFTFHIVEVVSKIESRSLDSQSARSIVETAEQDFARLRLEVSPLISGGPMDTDAQGNDTQGSNATQDTRGSAVDTQGSSTEQTPGADGAEAYPADAFFADLINAVEGDDAKGQGKGNRAPDRDDPFEGIFDDLGDDDCDNDDAELDNFFKDKPEQPRKRPAKGNGPEGTLTRSLARSATCAPEKDADADDFQLAFPELDNDKKPIKKRKGAPDAECTGQQKKKRPSRRLHTSGRAPRPRKTK